MWASTQKNTYLICIQDYNKNSLITINLSSTLHTADSEVVVSSEGAPTPAGISMFTI